MDKTLILLRGASGAGKSTFTRYLCDLCKIADISHIHLEADTHFYQDGQYKFDPSQLSRAHFLCRSNAESAMSKGISCVIVSNTSTTEKEIDSYIASAKDYYYTIVSLIVENRHGNSSLHNVPQETIEKQKQRLLSAIQL